MLYSEFTTLTGVEVSASEYAAIEEQYMASVDDKSTFCDKWLQEHKKRERAKRVKFQREHSIERLFAFMDGVASIGLNLCRSDLEIDKEVIASTKTDGAKLYWAVRKTGTQLFLYNIEALHKWNEQRGNRDDFAQYEITYLGDKCWDIRLINKK